MYQLEDGVNLRVETPPPPDSIKMKKKQVKPILKVMENMKFNIFK